eukprot:CAMPEP_0178420344 /NCGR_PEP_ID=MMETSP0689_2-20121128/26079_1 /TAXON_ID=160604 /ORGANISM="Amphidinium massartii, Strain CS-259" /LENGTH=300 /DNA_ID=CAMNT_0020041813 /DNA_START=44 /DNA_END=943 /DNA_ORIENTATION=+
MPGCRYLFVADLGDPVSCIHANEFGVMAGTMLGKVWLYNFNTKETDLLTAFSDEGIRGLYLDDELAHATICEGARSWQCSGLHMPGLGLNFRTLDKKSTQSVKHVLQRGPWACVLFPITTTLVHLGRQEQRQAQFRLFDLGSPSEVVPCDFDGQRLCIVDRTLSSRLPVYHIIHLEQAEQLELKDLPGSSHATLMKLWGSKFVVYSCGGAVVHIYDYKAKKMERELSGHRAEVLAIDAQDEVTIATLSVDAEVRLWNGATGECTKILHVPEANFFMGFPYHIIAREKHVCVAADQGVYLL